jgi:ribosomal protein L11 methyltransferase
MPPDPAAGARPPAATVSITVPAAEAELAADALWRAGTVAIEEREATEGLVLIAGVAAGGDIEPLLAAVAGRWPAEVVPVDLDAALDAWRKHARMVEVGNRLVVRPPWVPPEPRADGRIELVIDPGRAFGSGSHASTRLALGALDRMVMGGEHVLDVGCGSGVLAIAALRLGSARATGVDVNSAALDASRLNAERNGVSDRLSVSDDAVDHVAAARGPFDLVVANMLLPELVEVAGPLRAAVAPGGALVLSGVLAEQRQSLLAAYKPLEPAAEHADEAWLAVTFRAR